VQLHHVDETLGPCQALGEVEAGAEIPSGDVDDLSGDGVCLLCAISRNREGCRAFIKNDPNVTPGYISRLLRLPLLAPDIITAIVNGKNPPQLTAKKLMRLALELPVDWTEQRKLLGFH